jgi:hypothetical protein
MIESPRWIGWRAADLLFLIFAKVVQMLPRVISLSQYSCRLAI